MSQNQSTNQLSVSPSGFNTSYQFKDLPGFPFTLFHLKKYDASKTIVAIIFCLATVYFSSGFIGFMIDHNAWLHRLIYSSQNLAPSPYWWEFWKPNNPIANAINSTLSYIDIFFRLFIFLCAYCLAWVTFDPKNLEGYVMGLFNTIMGVTYVLSPADFIPDILPVVGSVDDTIFGVGIIILGLSVCNKHKIRNSRTTIIRELINQGNNKRALELLLEDKGITLEESLPVTSIARESSS